MRIKPCGRSSLSISDTTSYEDYAPIFSQISDRLTEFYRKRGCVFQSQDHSRRVSCAVLSNGKKLLEVLISHHDSQRIEENQTGESQVYYIHQFSALFKGEERRSTQERDLFLKENPY